MNFKKQLNQVRYNLHRDIRKEGYSLNTRKKTIYIFFEKIDISDKVKRLRDQFGYAIQTELDKPINSKQPTHE